MLDEINPKGDWGNRRKHIDNMIWYNMSELIVAAKDPKIGTSLAVVKPKEIIDFVWKPCERD